MPSKSKSFLYLPFRKIDKVKITEGWYYSSGEQRIHGHKIHYGIDFAADRGTPVLAAAPGLALSFYQLGYSGKYKGKRVGFGFGNYVQIWHPQANCFTLYAHLDAIAPYIPYIPDIKKDDEEISGVRSLTLAKIKKQGLNIKRGTVIGWMGDSGISWGYKEERGFRPDPQKFPSWDEVHMHFELYKRGNGFERIERTDPYGLYGPPSKYKLTSQEKGGLWVTDKNNKIKFAK